VEYFIDRYARKAGKNIKRVNKKTLELLQSYPWPGNIRELRNVIERSVILCETEIFSIDESWLPKQPSLTEPKNQMELPRRLLAQEKEMIEAALKESRGRIFGPTGAAAKLGIPRSTLESKIRSLKINKSHFKAENMRILGLIFGLCRGAMATIGHEYVPALSELSAIVLPGISPIVEKSGVSALTKHLLSINCEWTRD
jgi:hypothetical protein